MIQYKHRIRVSGIARRANEVLLVEQISPATGLRRWASPGGGLELGDIDIFRAVEREMLEETGLIVEAGGIRYMNEFFHSVSSTLMVDIWIDCFPKNGVDWGEISMEFNRHDDNITDLRWWTRGDFFAQDSLRANEPLLKPEFWDNLYTPAGPVIFLGRWEE